MATAGYHNRPTRWPEPQGKTWFLCALLLVGRTGTGRRGKGCLPKGWKRPEVLLFTPELPPCSDGLSGMVGCHLEAFSFSHFIIQCYPGSLAGEGEQKEREKRIIGEGSSDEIIVRKFCGTLELQPQALLPGGSELL